MSNTQPPPTAGILKRLCFYLPLLVLFHIYYSLRNRWKLRYIKKQMGHLGRHMARYRDEQIIKQIEGWDE